MGLASFVQTNSNAWSGNAAPMSVVDSTAEPVKSGHLHKYVEQGCRFLFCKKIYATKQKMLLYELLWWTASNIQRYKIRFLGRFGQVDSLLVITNNFYVGFIIWCIFFTQYYKIWNILQITFRVASSYDCIFYTQYYKIWNMLILIF